MFERVKHLEGLLKAELPTGEYVVINSVWLTLMGIRVNGDLDLMLSSKLWQSRFSDYPVQHSFGLPGPLVKRVRVHALQGGNYSRMTDVRNNDDAVYNHRVVLEGIPLIEPRLYFQYILKRLKKSREAVNRCSWWRRNRWTNPSHRKLFVKCAKDIRSVLMLQKYFQDGLPRSGLLAKITPAQWGQDQIELQELFPNSKQPRSTS
jgi:hypothetical protein